MAGWRSMLGAVAAFAVGPALAAALVQLRPLMSLQPAPGVLFFAAVVVVLTMVAVVSFVPRLIRDPDRTRGNHDA
jgi:uncharacterized paraquat-inducible protein A